MPLLDPGCVRRSLEQFAHRQRPVFGADVHRLRLNAVVKKVKIESFEKHHSIVLPPDYRHFLTAIGNGGAGPYYGIFPLGMMDDLGSKMKNWKEGDGFIGDLSKPFLLKEPWNDLSKQPSTELLDTNEREYERQLEAFEKIYWNPELLNGAIPICHLGCALRVWLVVTGEKAGQLWRDGRADNSGLSPIITKDCRHAAFSSWYLDWLRDPECMR